MLDKVGKIVIRVFELLFAICVLAFSVTACNWQITNPPSATFIISAFAGGFGMAAALLGTGEIWFRAPGMFMAIVDGLATLIFLVGGIAFAVGIKGVDCTNPANTTTACNKLFTGGCSTVDGVPSSSLTEATVKSRCRLSEADTAFLFLGFIASLVAAGFSYYFARERRRGGSKV